MLPRLAVAIMVASFLVAFASAAPKPVVRRPPPKGKVVPSPAPQAAPSPLPRPTPTPTARPTPAPKPPKKLRSPSPSPPPQGKAPTGAAIFYESTSSSPPIGFRIALVADAIRLRTLIMAAVKKGGDGDALGDGWINGKAYGYQIFNGANPSLKNGPFMYTSLPLPSGPMWQVVYENQTVPYGYRLANCLEVEANFAAIAGWRGDGLACRAQQGYAYPKNATTDAFVSCPPPPSDLNVSKCGIYTRWSVQGCQFASGYTLMFGVNVNGSTFDPKPKEAGNTSFLGDWCTNRKKCVGFNTDGDLKSVLPAYRDLLQAYPDRSTCQGFYTPTQRAGCSLPDYTFYWSYDSPGGDYTTLPSNTTRAAMAQACSLDSNCQGFVTSGTTKVQVQDRSQWTQWSTEKCQGLYVRNIKGVPRAWSN